MPRNGTKIKIDVAILQEQHKELITKLDIIDKKIDNVQLCTKDHDNRISSLEETKKDEKESKEMSRKDMAIIISVIVLGINVVFWLIEHFVGV